MTEQRTPDEQSIQAENELICEKLLSWRKIPPIDPIPGIEFVGWRHDRSGCIVNTPSFTTWADAGLILDQFEGRAPIERVDSERYRSAAEQQMVKLSLLLRAGKLRPADIRAAALSYIRSLP